MFLTSALYFLTVTAFETNRVVLFQILLARYNLCIVIVKTSGQTPDRKTSRARETIKISRKATVRLNQIYPWLCSKKYREDVSPRPRSPGSWRFGDCSICSRCCDGRQLRSQGLEYSSSQHIAGCLSALVQIPRDTRLGI